MIERFNFFDVYAYVLPGATLLGLLWLPLGIATGTWPPADLSSALMFLVAAYITGHVLYRPAKDILPTETTGWYIDPTTGRHTDPPKWRKDTPAHPSDFILDAAELTLTTEFKHALQDLINTRFKREIPNVAKAAVKVDIDFNWDKEDEKECRMESKSRELAFFLCRSTLVSGDAASYGEQFEGLYQFLRYLTVIFALGCAYHLGWALAMWRGTSTWRIAPGVVAGIAIICAAAIDSWGRNIIKDREGDTKEQKDTKKRLKKHIPQIVIGFLLLTLFLCPFSLRCVLNDAKLTVGCRVALLLGAVLVDLFVTLRCLSAYKHFANEFAKAIYRDFYVYATSGRKPTK